MYTTYDNPVKGEEATYQALKNDPILSNDIAKGDLNALNHLLSLSVRPAN